MNNEAVKLLLAKNKEWAEELKKSDPDFFINLSNCQNPKYLWIGCSDSRVPANQILNCKPGEVFVHRNIANVVVHTDLNCLSVLQYAVDVLKVEGIIVCGHYGCGGVKAAMEDTEHGLIDNWLEHIRDIRRLYKKRIDNCSNEEEQTKLLCELNVCEQVRNVYDTTIVRNALRRGQELSVYGLIYNLEDGILKELDTSRD